MIVPVCNNSFIQLFASCLERHPRWSGLNLNLLKLVIENSTGDINPRTDDAARYKLGTACLMVNDLFLNSKEKEELASDSAETQMLALATHMLATYEVINMSLSRT